MGSWWVELFFRERCSPGGVEQRRLGDASLELWGVLVWCFVGMVIGSFLQILGLCQGLSLPVTVGRFLSFF